jgi:hypothetical protein
MSDEPKKRSRAWTIGAALTLLALYMLSIGPATVVSLRTESVPVLIAYKCFYWPLRTAGRQSESVARVIDSYNTWWIRHFPGD